MSQNLTRLKIIIAGGGTGGHLYPGVALAEELVRLGADVLFIVKKNDRGIKILKDRKIPYEEITASGFPRRAFHKLFGFVFASLSGLFASVKLLGKIRPAVVVGMGGYTSFAAVLAGRLMKIPALIHEQNCIPGLTNRILSKFATKIATSFSESQKYFPSGKTILTGNPVRPEILSARRNAAIFNLDEDKFTVFVFGGSQGASAINYAIVDSLVRLTGYKNKLQFIHATGEKDFEFVADAYRRQSFKSVVQPYIHNIESAYALADLVICRAGATTIGELKCSGIPAIFIPYPHATADHQFYNASAYLSSGGVGEIVIEKDLSPELLVEKIIKYSDNPREKKPVPLENLPQKLIAKEILRIAVGD